MSLPESTNRAAQSFTGRLLRPSDEDYDDLRRVHNGLIDRHPALIARVGGVADIVEAIALARELGLEVAVRGGGHNVAGHATVDLQTAPDGSNARLAAIAAAHSGSLSNAEKAVRPIKAFGPPVMDMLGPIPYSALNTMLDPAFPKGARNYWKAQLLTDLSDDAIDTLVHSFEACPSPLSHLIIEHLHGAASRVPVDSTACTLRTTGFNVVIISQWADARDTERNVAWARETFSSLTPYLAPTRYVNYLEGDATEAAAVAYGTNLDRLRDLKTKWDPDNFFHRNVNILPR